MNTFEMKLWTGLFKEAFKQGFLIDLPPDHLWIATLIQRHDFVAAIWVDDTVPSGFGICSVKGYATLAEGKQENITMTAVPCFDKAGAMALQTRYGGPADLATGMTIQ